MCNDMIERGVTSAAMESTAVYWMPVWNELCESMELKLVNPYFIRQLPSRKSDIKDAQWIAECLLKNLIKGSFVPESIVQDMRKLNRRIMDLNEDKSKDLKRLSSTDSHSTYLPTQCNYLCGATQPGLQICRGMWRWWTPA